jgi:hypothetical protein
VSSQGGLLYRRGLGTAARPGGCSTLTFRSFPLLLAGAFATSHFFLRCRRPHLAERCPHRWREGQRPKSAQHAAHFLDPGGRRKLPPLPPPRRWRQCDNSYKSRNPCCASRRRARFGAGAATRFLPLDKGLREALKRQREDRRANSRKVFERPALGGIFRGDWPVVSRNQTGSLLLRAAHFFVQQVHSTKRTATNEIRQRTGLDYGDPIHAVRHRRHAPLRDAGC